MKKYLVIVLLITTYSCNKVNQDELDLTIYVKEDLELTQLRINNQLEYLRQYAQEQPHKYGNVFKEVSHFNDLSLELENVLLKSSDVKIINSEIEGFLSDSSLQKFKEYMYNDSYPNIASITSISTNTQKFQFLRRLKEINYLASHQIINSILYSWTGSSIDRPYFLLERINENQLALNVYSEMVKRSPQDFDRTSFQINEITDVSKKVIKVKQIDQNLINRFILNTNKDTVALNAAIKSNRKIKFVLATNNSQLIVGQPKPFDKDLLQNYFEVLQGSQD